MSINHSNPLELLDRALEQLQKAKEYLQKDPNGLINPSDKHSATFRAGATALLQYVRHDVEDAEKILRKKDREESEARVEASP